MWPLALSRAERLLVLGRFSPNCFVYKSDKKTEIKVSFNKFDVFVLQFIAQLFLEGKNKQTKKLFWLEKNKKKNFDSAMNNNSGKKQFQRSCRYFQPVPSNS